MNLLEIDSVWLSYKLTKILQNVYIKCETREVVGLLGNNGAGKSSLLKIAMGLMQESWTGMLAGTQIGKCVRVNNVYVKEPFSVKGLINYLPQREFIPKNMKVKTALDLYDASIEALLPDFPELADLLDLTFGELSGGQCRWIETLVILKADTKFTILDEPFSHISPLQIEKIKQVIHFEKERKGIIVTDHLYKHIKEISDSLYFIKNGRTIPIRKEDDLAYLGYI